MKIRSTRGARAAAALLAAGGLFAAAAAWAAPEAWPGAARPVVAQTADLESLRLPPGFTIQTFAEGLENVRFMAVGPEGDLYASLINRGRIIRLPDRDGDGQADRRVTWAEGLNRPHGLAFRDGWLYVGETNRVTRIADADSDGVGDQREALADLPTEGGGHSTRTVDFGPDGMLYVSIGSSCNVCIEADPRRAAIVQYSSEGTDERVYARGLRNAVGITFHPISGELWAANNGRDLLGDDYPPEAISIVRDGDDFGWPRCINGAEPDPQFGGPGACDGVVRPTLEIQAHSAPLGLTFYTADRFPQEYQGDLFIAYHGSWNRSEPTGFKLVRVRMQDGRPTGEVEDFATGWLQGREHWGRPVAPIVGADGSLYLSDDKAGRIYRISYTG